MPSNKVMCISLMGKNVLGSIIITAQGRMVCCILFFFLCDVLLEMDTLVGKEAASETITQPNIQIGCENNKEEILMRLGVLARFFFTSSNVLLANNGFFC